MSEQNKTIYRRLAKEFIEQNDAAVAYEFLSDDHVNHSLNVRGPEQYKAYLALADVAFPDRKITVNFQIAEGDKVLNYCTFQATHTGELMGIAPTGKQVTYDFMSIGRIVDGKVLEEWTVKDTFSLMQQLGVIPPMGGGEQ